MGPRPGSKAQQPSPEQTPSQKVETQSTKENTPEELKAAALEKKKREEDKIKQDSREKRKNMLGLGGDFGLLLKKLFKSFGSFLAEFDGIKDKMANIFTAQSPEDIRKITAKSKNYKLPAIKNPDTIVTTIENSKPDEKLVAYLYRCLKISIPTKKELHPHKKLNIRHLMFQMMGSFQFAKGRKDILTGFTKKPQKFYKNDIVFFRNAISDKLTAGFVQEIGDHTVKVTTIDETGTKRTIPKYKNMCLMAFHIPGNKSKGVVPVKKKKKPKYEVD